MCGRCSQRYPLLMGKLSYRPGLTDAEGHFSAEWKALIVAYPDCFLIGSDTWVNARWNDYEGLIPSVRLWLGDLPPSTAQCVASGNAAQLFGVAARRCRHKDASTKSQAKKSRCMHRLFRSA